MKPKTSSSILAGMFTFMSVIASSQASAYDCDASCQAHIEQGVKLYNQFEYDQAKAVFQAEADKGNAHALYWLGVAHYETGKYSDAGDSFLQAAEMGDPWAMELMVPGGLRNPCDFRGWSCDDDWKEKALEGFKKLADQGDGKAMYAYYRNKSYWWKPFTFYEKKKRASYYDDIIKSGWYGVLRGSSAWNDDDKYLNHLISAAESGYAPAMVNLFYENDEISDSEALKWIFKALELGYGKAAESLSYAYNNGDSMLDVDYHEAYMYHKIAIALGSDISGSPKVKLNIEDDFGLYKTDMNGDFIYEILITPEEQADLDKQAEAFLKRVKPNRFLDEATHKLFN
ncbi:sel1 repeat family protein [Photobacterium japonica]|uniref:tetratricopeptide repeat protein n=1 Tax=Photobacterium japonica TaxID=2910235 RepID=UPI003D0BB65F